MDEKLRRAFQLAHFILGERQAALRVTQEAIATLDVALAAQDKRLYYAPQRDGAPGGMRTKVSLSELQLLQRLVYIATEPEERRQEVAGAPLAVWWLHYLKQLARITLKRNSFFATLGVSRLLHTYNTPETMQIYGAVVQDPARVRDDSYFRRCKAQMMNELRARFGAPLAVTRGVRGEERFQTSAATPAHHAIVRNCLTVFTPWETRCPVPARFDIHRDELSLLRFRGGDPDGEHAVETARFHAVLHPDCYARLLTALQLDAPDQRLELPQFQLSDGGPPDDPASRKDRRPTPEISEEEMQYIKEYLAQQRESRKRFSPKWLRVVVDGVARGTLATDAPTRIALTPGAEVIEVFGTSQHDNEELRLAAQLLSYDEADQLRPAAVTLTLEGGQQICFNVEPGAHAQDEGCVTVQYRKTVSSFAWLQGVWPFPAFTTGTWNWRPAPVAALLVALGLSLAYWLFATSSAPPDHSAHRATPTPDVSVTPRPEVSPAATPSATPRLLGNNVIARNLSARDEASSLTRSERETATGLLEARTVYLPADEPDAWQRRVNEQVRTQLAALGRFTLTANRDEADIALKLTLAPVGQAPDRLTLTARLVDAEGKVIWPLTPRVSGRRYAGPTAKVIEQFSSDLARDLRRLERK